MGKGMWGHLGWESPWKQVRSLALVLGCVCFSFGTGVFPAQLRPLSAAGGKGRARKSKQQPATQINLFPISGRAMRVWYFTKQFLPLIGS